MRVTCGNITYCEGRVSRGEFTLCAGVVLSHVVMIGNGMSMCGIVKLSEVLIGAVMLRRSSVRHVVGRQCVVEAWLCTEASRPIACWFHMVM